MFFRSKKKDAFAERVKIQEVWKTVRRIIDVTSPNLVLQDAESGRTLQRYNRCIPVMMAPIDDEGGAIPAQSFFAATRDFSDNGLSLISNKTLESGQWIVGFDVDQPILFLGDVVRSQPFGGDLFEVGIVLHEVIESGGIHMDLAQQFERLKSGSPTGA
ncbi:MAG: hypothetical protein ACI87E_005071 [Mariniblastus sp.]|jgi:hypothetical protein